MRSSLFILGAALFLGVWSQEQTPTTTITTTFYPYPTGVADGRTEIDSMIPLPCSEVCQLIVPSYLICYLFTTTDRLGMPYDFNQTACDEYLCTQDRYDLLSACLNCVIANGDERPRGYAFNTSLTTIPATLTQTLYPEALPNPEGLIDQRLAEAMLKNVSEGCARAERNVQGATTLTASPTTTGPYYTRWTSGETQQIDIWTGLTQYTEDLTALLATITFAYPSGTGTPDGGPDSTAIGPGDRGSSERQSRTSSAPAPAATTSGGAMRGNPRPGAGASLLGGGAMVWLLGWI